MNTVMEDHADGKTTGALKFVLNNATQNLRVNDTLPSDLRFTSGHVVSIVAYSILIVISAVGNITVLTTILRRRRKSHTRINTMLMHLTIADLLVTFLMMPLEVFWAATVEWIVGDTMCRLAMFFRIFGLYLSSFVIICISVDRYLAVLKPMNLYQIDRRGKIMLTSAWLASFICSAPQSVIFHVEKHPNATEFEQCVIFNSFASKEQELAYFYFCMIMMYFLPLAVILFCYTSIVIEIYNRSKNANLGSKFNHESIRRSGLGFLGRAKSRTLKMTIIIVAVFIICWTPYYIISIWYFIDRVSFQSVDDRVKRGIFVFASTNSCMNPIVYGIFNIRTKKTTAAILQKRNRAYSATTACATDIRLPALTLSLRSVE